MNKTVRAIADWTIAPKLQKLTMKTIREIDTLIKHSGASSILNANAQFKDKHKGERCFILGCAPSINALDIKLLKDEHCICLNEFYKHPDYEILNPKYHIRSPFAVHPNVDEQSRINYFKEFNDEISRNSILFFDYRDKKYIENHDFAKNDKVFYTLFTKQLNDLRPQATLDATKQLYLGNSVSMMAIQVALYLGFEEVYLAGVTHDTIIKYAIEFIKANYENKITDIDLDKLSNYFPWHFYKQDSNVLYRETNHNFWEKYDWHHMFNGLHNTMNQYKILNQYAEDKGVKIINAHKGGILSMFPTVEYEQLFN